MLKCSYIFAQAFRRPLAGLLVGVFGLDRGPQPLVVLAEAELQLGVFGIPVDELPRAAGGPVRAAEIPKLLLSVPNDGLFYVLVGMVAPAYVAAFEYLARVLEGAGKL